MEDAREPLLCVNTEELMMGARAGSSPSFRARSTFVHAARNVIRTLDQESSCLEM